MQQPQPPPKASERRQSSLELPIPREQRWRGCTLNRYLSQYCPQASLARRIVKSCPRRRHEGGRLWEVVGTQLSRPQQQLVEPSPAQVCPELDVRRSQAAA